MLAQKLSPIETLKLTSRAMILHNEIAALADKDPLGKLTRIKELVQVRVRLAGAASAAPAPAIETIEDAKAYFNAQLKGKVVKTAAGDVHIIGSTWREFKRGMKSDDLKAKAIVHTLEVLESGQYEGKVPNNKQFKADVIAYHFFSKGGIKIDDKVVSVGVTVEELKDGMLSFNLKAYGLSHSEHPHWRKKIGDVNDSGHEPEIDTPKGNDEPVTLDSTVPENVDDVNFVILGVWDKDGNPVAFGDFEQELLND